MKTRFVSYLAALLGCAAAAATSPASADGGYFPPEEVVSGESDAFVEMVDQRALLWVRSETTELWLQDRYRGDVDSFGWVVPIPHLPEVSCIEDRVLDALDYETAPVFREITWTCWGGWGGDTVSESSCDVHGCGTHLRGDDSEDMAGAGSDTAEDYQEGADVSVWSTGSTECLDYSIVSSSDGGALVEWLAERGLGFEESAATVFEGYASRGFVFLVAEVSPDPSPDEATANQTVRISWPNLSGDDVVYPMILTGATAEVDMGLRLYVAADETMLPINYHSSLVEVPWTGEHDLQSYRDALDDALALADGRNLVLEYTGDLEERYEECDFDEYDYWYDGAWYGECPGEAYRPTWLENVWSDSSAWAELTAASPRVTRLTAMLSPENMDEDVLLAGVDHPDVDPTFYIEHYCDDYDYYMAHGGASSGLFAGGTTSLARGLFALLVLLAIAVRRRPVAIGSALALCLVLGCGSHVDADEPGDAPETIPDSGPEIPDEVCDGLDNDGNGLTDEWWPALGEDCTAGLGACAVVGTWVCADAGDVAVCDGETGEPSDETCNGVDDDCNGVCDDGFECCRSVYYPCANACGHIGEARCGSSCEHGVCEADPPDSLTDTGIQGEGIFGSTFAFELTGAAPSEVAFLSVGASPALHVFGASQPEVSFPLPALDVRGYRAVDWDWDGDDEVAIDVMTSDGESVQREVVAVFDVVGSEAVEIARIGEVEAPHGEGAFFVAPEEMAWVAVLETPTEGTRTLATVDTTWHRLYRWTLANGIASIDSGPFDLIGCQGAYGLAQTSHAGDLDGDGFGELMLTCAPQSTYLIDGEELAKEEAPVLHELEDRAPLGFSDLDHDGDDDAIVWTPAGQIEAFSYPDLSWMGSLLVPAWIGGTAVYYWAVADLDGDGFDEIAMGHHDAESSTTYTLLTVATDPLISSDYSDLGATVSLTGVDQHTGLFALDWDGEPGLDLFYGFGVALSPAGCEVE